MYSLYFFRYQCTRCLLLAGALLVATTACTTEPAPLEPSESNAVASVTLDPTCRSMGAYTDTPNSSLEARSLWANSPSEPLSLGHLRASFHELIQAYLTESGVTSYQAPAIAIADPPIVVSNGISSDAVMQHVTETVARCREIFLETTGNPSQVSDIILVAEGRTACGVLQAAEDIAKVGSTRKEDDETTASEDGASAGDACESPTTSILRGVFFLRPDFSNCQNIEANNVGGVPINTPTVRMPKGVPVFWLRRPGDTTVLKIEGGPPAKQQLDPMFSIVDADDPAASALAPGNAARHAADLLANYRPPGKVIRVG